MISEKGLEWYNENCYIEADIEIIKNKYLKDCSTMDLKDFETIHLGRTEIYKIN